MAFIIYDANYHWPNPVPIRFDETVLKTPGAVAKILSAVNAWNKVSSLKLVHDGAEKAVDYITIGAIAGGGGGGSSELGRQGGQQWLWADFSASYISTLLQHEIGHAVGLIHEHQRPDRDAFITSHRVPAWDGKKLGNIQIDVRGQAIGPYDCASLMHYLDIDDYVDPKPGRCTTLSNTVGLSDGDLAALDYLSGARYRILNAGKWASRWSHIVPFEYKHREYLLTYAWSSGKVRFDSVDDGGRGTTNWGQANWAKIWDVVITFELGYERFLLVYDRKTGAVRIDKIFIDDKAHKIWTENVWQGNWSQSWRHVVPLGVNGFQRDHILVYDASTGIVRLDRVNRDKKPGFGTTNLWQRKWLKMYTTVMPFRLGLKDWYVLVYAKHTGNGFVYQITETGYKKVQNIAWGKGWTDIVFYAQHSDYSYHDDKGPEPSARFLAYRATDGVVHFDRMFKNRMEIMGRDTWAKGWDSLVPFCRGEAGRFHLGNDGLIVYEYNSGTIHFDQLL